MRAKALIAITIVAALLATTSVIAAQDQVSRPTAAIALGDSYIAGEAGRWQGNSPINRGDRDDTDRAAVQRRWFGFSYQPELIYGITADSGCNRSDISPLISAELSVDATINLACSGASTANVISSAAGGVSHNGELPQVDQLRSVANDYDVEVVVLSIGGNDLGFSNIIIDCVARYVTSSRFFPNTCARSQAANVAEQMPAAMAGVTQAIEDVRRTLDTAGDDDYRIVLQTYPKPIPQSSDFRYPETGWRRTFTGGCPFWDSDADWANQELLPAIRSNLADVAAETGVELLDLSDALAGREACASGASHGAGPDAEWFRFVTTGIGQGQSGESVHPNFYGQQALGTCLALHIAAGPGDSRCQNTPNTSPDQMILVR